MSRKRPKPKLDRTMPMVHPNAAAIDIGATMHMAAVRADRTPEPVRSFGTFTTDLHRLVNWLKECGVETVVMESTSVYWIPIFELLDARGFTVFLVNARDAKHVPGRKTDVSDAQWLQRLHSYGLLRASFRPKGQIVKTLPNMTPPKKEPMPFGYMAKSTSRGGVTLRAKRDPT